MNFYKKYIELCNKIGKSPSAVVLDIGLSKPTVNRWKNGGSPTDATASKIASYFGVSVAYLLEDEEKKPVLEDELKIKNVKFIGRDGTVKFKKLTPEMISMLEQLPDSDEDL